MARTFAWRLISAMVVCCCVSAAVAADGEKKRPDPELIFKKRDANGDGLLTLEEFKTGLPERALAKADARFKKLDTSGDGKVSLDEFKAGQPPKK
ncbi:MAG: EF-hand domain-containing protein [Planctomycetota bacterium]